MVARYLEQKNREKHFISLEGQLDKLASGAASAKSKSKDKRKRNSGDCVLWTTKGKCSRGEKFGMKHDPEKRRKSKGKRKGSRPSSSPRRNSLEIWSPDRKRKAANVLRLCKMVIVQKGMPLITGIHLSVLFIKRELQTWE